MLASQQFQSLISLHLGVLEVNIVFPQIRRTMVTEITITISLHIDEQLSHNYETKSDFFDIGC